MKEYTKISSELTELMHATKPYSSYPWRNAEVCVTEDSFEIQYPGLEYPMVKVLEDNEKAKIQMYFQLNEELNYKKGTQSKQADLIMSYYVNMGQYNQVLYCTLEANDGKDVYDFLYDEKLNTIFEYNDSVKEELRFTKELQYFILTHCQGAIDSLHRIVDEAKDVSEFLLQEIGYKNILWKEDQSADVLEYALMDYCDQYEKMTDYSEIGNIFPLYQWRGQKMAEDLFVVEKDGLYGVINKDNLLVLPMISTQVPTADENHVHYTPAEQYRNTSLYYLPHSQYQTCQGEHGSNGYYYFLIEGADQVIKTTYGHEGPYGIAEFKGNELNGLLNTYELIRESDSTENIIWIEETRFEKTGKYGVFSEEGIVTDAIYDDALFIDADLAAVKKGEHWGYVDDYGNEVIPNIYNTCMNVSYYEFVYPAKDGYVVVKDDNNLFGVLDYNGNVLVPFDYEFATPYFDKSVLLKRNNEWFQVEPFTATYTSLNFSLSSGVVKART
ncbi:MAG: WG repeat-containing protein [Erysipelotrichaceae bacterium]|nr:WG repeat-containing protein [Erysipelotrichaceae bacterium]